MEHKILYCIDGRELAVDQALKEKYLLELIGAILLLWPKTLGRELDTLTDRSLHVWTCKI